jgi:hypothetical protein
MQKHRLKGDHLHSCDVPRPAQSVSMFSNPGEGNPARWEDASDNRKV